MTKQIDGITISEKEIDAVRIFDAPRTLVFEAMTRPEHLRRWYGPRSLELVVCEVDLREGGSYRYVSRTPDGKEFGFHGEYLEVIPNEKVVQTWIFDPFPNSGSIETATFEDFEGKTRVHLHSEFKTAEDLAGWANSGGPAGMAETLERLDELVEELAVQRESA